MPELRLTIPGVPPSGNHYKAFRVVTPRGGKAFAQWYLTAEAKDWMHTVQVIGAGRKLRGESYTISVAVFTPTARALDLDNAFKCILDSLQHSGVIDNDKRVTDLHGYRRIDRLNPRTEVIVRTTQETLFQEAAS